MDELFPDAELLSISDVMKLTGKCYNTTKRYFPFKGHTSARSTWPTASRSLGA